MLVFEWRILRSRTIRSCSPRWLAESLHPVEMSTEASVCTSRCASNHFGGHPLHHEELRLRSAEFQREPRARLEATDKEETPHPCRALAFRRGCEQGCRSKCCLCGKKIDVGSLRWMHRIRLTTWPKDNRWTHEGCLARLPPESLGRDVALIESLKVTEQGHEDRRTLHRVLALRRTSDCMDHLMTSKSLQHQYWTPGYGTQSGDP